MREPYKAGMAKTAHQWERVDITAELIVIMDTQSDERGLKLIAPFTRAVLKHQIHELLMTDEREASPGKEVNRVAGVGFIEFTRGGLIVAGDKVWIGDRCLGEVAGFDETHMPNHQNIVIKAEQRSPGVKLGLQLGSKVLISRGR